MNPAWAAHLHALEVEGSAGLFARHQSIPTMHAQMRYHKPSLGQKFLIR
jgi:hypothetical protein